MNEETLVPKLRFAGFDDEWKTFKLGEIITLMQSGLSRQLSVEDIGVPVLRSNNIVNGHIDLTDIKYWYLKDTKGATTENYFLKKNDLLVNFINSVSKMGKSSVYNNELDRPAIFTTNLMRLNFKKNIDTYFIYYFFNTAYYKNYIDKITKPAVNQASFTTKDFKKMEIPIPNLLEQEKIAYFFKLIDKKINLLENKYRKYSDFKKYMMQQIFEQKLRFNFEDEWKIVKLKNVGEINTGNTPSTKNKEYYTPEKYLWVTPSDISSKYILNTERKLSEEGSKKGRFVKKNSVLVTCIASIGKNCIITEDGYFNQQINSITPNKDYDYEFIYYLICHNSERMKKYAGITATPILNKKSFENMKFEFPSLNEQKKIKNTLSNIDNKIFYLENIITKTQNFKKGLLQQMFV